MKVVFLDVDGVLNSMEWATKVMNEQGVDVFYRDMLDPDAIACLKKIVDETGARIVVSSTWRLIRKAMDALRLQLSEAGLNICSVTPDINENIDDRRGQEIASWISEHEDVEGFVILDDDSDMGSLMPHLVKTSFHDGLLSCHVEPAIQILNQPLAG